MRTLLVDNYDSYTFNLFQMLAMVNDEEPLVVRNDALSVREALSWQEAGEVDNIVISPGPGHPGRSNDFGVGASLIETAQVPILGVCLGHQGLAMVAGGNVVHAPEPMHGRESRIWHDESELFRDIPQGFTVVRYHSLIASEPLAADLLRSAWTDDGLVMGVRHRTKPWWGVQFHPEAICSEHGHQLLANFRDLTPRRRKAVSASRATAKEHATTLTTTECSLTDDPASQPPYSVFHRSLDGWTDPEQVFDALFDRSDDAYWLDSSRTGDSGGRFTFMGDASGPASETVQYDVSSGTLTVHRAGDVEQSKVPVLDYAAARLQRRVVAPELPFDFVGGFVGYLGYEMKADCEGEPAHRSPHPDASLIFADRFLAFDHEQRQMHLVALVPAGEEAATDLWFDRVRRTLFATNRDRGTALAAVRQPVEAAPHTMLHHPPDYLSLVSRCLDYLRDGESYEICLTNRIDVAAPDVDPLEIYRVLRRINPAPYAAYLRFGDMAVLSSSPERFLRIDRDRQIEAKPIKGTVRRGSTPGEDAELAERLREDTKTRAENMMIVDLMRNDLSRVSEIGSVHVPSLMAVESYETVHQLVSTVRGRLREGLDAVDAVRATFPGGSMTGAPKKRTMELIDSLEGAARGVYSGAIGYLSMNGTADLNIVIRTIVARNGHLTIGTGGAVVAQSDPAEELAETLLKAEAPLRAVAIAQAARRSALDRSSVDRSADHSLDEVAS